MKTTKVCQYGVLTFSLALLLAGAVLCANASQIALSVNTTTSTLDASLCANPGLGQSCDSDSANVTGYLIVALDDNYAPTQVSLRDFDLQANRALSLRLSWLFGLVYMQASATDLGIAHASPGPANPFYSVSATVFNATNVPCQLRGVASYSANDVACTFLQNNGLPCSGAFDLSTNGPITVDSIPGRVWVSNGVVYAHVEMTLTNYLDEANPSTGTIIVHGVVNASAPIPNDLVTFNSIWRYLDNGTDPGATWFASDFNDTAWPSGPAELGYGDGDEATTNSFGPDPNNKYITTYYRRAFNVPDPASYSNLLLRLLRDDGAVVYLNNQEVFRSNMPEGPITPSTPAVVAVAGGEETMYFAKWLAPSLLVAGRNVFAVEVHQVNGTSSDLSFNLELQGNVTSFSNQLPTIAITSPVGLALSSGFVLEPTVSDPDGAITLVEYFQNGVKIGQSMAYPWSLAVPALCPGSYTFSARAWDNSDGSADSAPVQINVLQAGPVLVAQGSVWKYLDNGIDQGTAWRGLTFNDSAWLSGHAEFGYGDGDEVTTNYYGPDPDNKYVTTYYRQEFTVTNLNTMLGMVLRLLRDDGAVVYLNSNEVFRSNMPTGPITYGTYALASLSGTDETTFVTAALPTNYLTLGINLLAVEIHQATSNSSDISFDLELSASYPNQPPQVSLLVPLDGTEIPAGAPFRIAATAMDPENSIAHVDFYADNDLLGSDSVAPYEIELSSYPSGRYAVTAVAYDTCGLSSVSASSQVSIGAFSMIPAGAVWKYRDNGQFPGTGWTTTTYSDAYWPSGAAELGYGDGDEVTTNSFGPDSNNKYITTWYRHSWTVPDKSLISGLTIRLLRDDGAVVYLNHVEVFRSNMPEGTITPTTLATYAVAGAEETTWFTKAISPSYLQNGLNVLAVEIHQSSSNSTDISFNCELVAAVYPTAPYLDIDQSGGNTTLRWSSWAVGYKPYQTHSLTPPIDWQPVPAAFSDDGIWRTLPVPTDTNVFYRLSW